MTYEFQPEGSLLSTSSVSQSAGSSNGDKLEEEGDFLTKRKRNSAWNSTLWNKDED